MKSFSDQYKRLSDYDFALIADSLPPATGGDETWEEAFDAEAASWQRTKLLWESRVPGSRARESVLAAGIVSMGLMGYDTEQLEKLAFAGLDALAACDKVGLTQITARIFREIRKVKKLPSHAAQQFIRYDDWHDLSAAMKRQTHLDFPNEGNTNGQSSNPFCVNEKYYRARLLTAWQAQIVGGALGTQLEGYSAQNIEKRFGSITSYIKSPSTYNDDITFQIAFLDAFTQKGLTIESEDIAEAWIGRIPVAWSAEDIALRNIAAGIYPPESGRVCNPFREWIGAQMRGSICGLLAPAQPTLAASLAFKDARVSHAGDGILGEIFNAVLCSLAFARKDSRELLQEAMRFIPDDTEYASVLRFAWDMCQTEACLDGAYKKVFERYKRYNWIHAYPNAAIEVLVLYFCENNFVKCLIDSARLGWDADCNAAQLCTIVALLNEPGCIPESWLNPIGDELLTYVRGYEKWHITELSEMTVQAALQAGTVCFV